MDGQPLVTVCTVSFNSSSFIRDTIHSVLAQTYTNFEYIIADDASTDATWDIISEYRDPRMISYRNEINLGEYPNRNKAIELASGKYLIFIDGDDIIFPHGLRFFVDMMERFPEAGMAIQKNYYNNILFPAMLFPEETIRNHFYGAYDLLSLSFASDFFKTALLKKWKLSTKYITGDEEIRFKIALHYPVLFVAGWVSWPRETPGRASGRIEELKGWKEAYEFTSLILEHAGDSVISKELKNDILLTRKKELARMWMNMMGKAKFLKAGQLLRETGFTWTDALKFAGHRPVFRDALDAYTPMKPFKRDFLSWGHQ